MERKEIVKTIATCTPSEFMAQGYRLAGKAKALFEMAGIADGAIVGSAIVKIVEKYGDAAGPHIYEYVKSMKDAVMEA